MSGSIKKNVTELSSLELEGFKKAIKSAHADFTEAQTTVLLDQIKKLRDSWPKNTPASEDDFKSNMEAVEKKLKMSSYMYIGAAALVIVAVAGGGYYFYRSKKRPAPV